LQVIIVALASLCAACCMLARTMLIDPGVIPRLEAIVHLTASPDGRSAMRLLCEMYCTAAASIPVASRDPASQPVDTSAQWLERFDRLPCELESTEAIVASSEYWAELMTSAPLLRFRRCGTCRTRKLPRSSHCKFCDNCVVDWDHHCRFVGNCIGARNHKSFVVFLLLSAASTALLVAVATWDAALAAAAAVRRGLLPLRAAQTWTWAILGGGGAAACLGLLAALCGRGRFLRAWRREMRAVVVIAWAMWLALSVSLEVLPVWPIVADLVLAPVLVVLGSTLIEQIALIGRGLTVKQVASGGPRLPPGFSWRTLAQFFAYQQPESLSGAHAEVAKSLREDAMQAGGSGSEGSGSEDDDCAFSHDCMSQLRARAGSLLGNTEYAPCTRTPCTDDVVERLSRTLSRRDSREVPLKDEAQNAVPAEKCAVT